MRWRTTSGGYVTAVSREDAARLAAECGMGAIERPAAAPRTTPRPAAGYMIWDDLCQAERASAVDLTSLAREVCERPELIDEGNVVALTVRGTMRALTPAERRQWHTLIEDGSE